MVSAPPDPTPGPPRGGPGRAWAALTRGWKIGLGVAGAIVLVVLIAALAAAGAQEDERTVTERITVAAADETPPPARTVTSTRTVTRTVTARRPARPPAQPAGAQRWSGNGSRNLGTVEVAADSTLRWTNDGGLFQIFDDDFGMHVNSQGASGETAVAAGTYTGVLVNALGNWTIEIRPGG